MSEIEETIKRVQQQSDTTKDDPLPDDEAERSNDVRSLVERMAADARLLRQLIGREEA